MVYQVCVMIVTETTFYKLEFGFMLMLFAVGKALRE